VRDSKRLAGGEGARYLLLASAVFLVLVGLVMIYSAASVSDYVRYQDSAHHLKRQLMWIGLGLIGLLVAARLDYRSLRRLAFPAWGVSVVLLLFVKVQGAVRGGARRWIDLGPLGTFQPSEFAKLACVMLTAYLVTEWYRGRLTERELLGRVAFSVGITAGLVLIQPDLGTTISILVSVAIVLIIGGVGMRWIGASVALIAGLGALAIAIEPYRLGRFTAFLNPFADPQGVGYQTIQARLAFGTGGWTGIGLGLSRQKFFYLPEAHTDFILAIIGEETGLLGTLAVVAAFVAFAYAGTRIALGTRDTFGRLLAGGLTGMIATQALMNMAAVTGLMPVTGKPLPLVSFGGSSMLLTAACIGLILSVSSHGALAPRAVRVKPSEKESERAIHPERRGDRGTHLPRSERGRKAVRHRA
jgi:cell division protein FtsW